MTSGTRRFGDFCWINILTPQPDKARAFFGHLLGWTYIELPGMGHAAQVGGKRIGGVFDHASPNTPKGMPPIIGVMVKVESVDASCRVAKALGGKFQAPFDIGDQGRMAVVTDPNGADIDLWEPKKGQGMEVDNRLHGAPTWFETLTTDVDRAASFYAGLFGWKPEIKLMPGMTYTTFDLGGTLVGGMMAITPQMGPIKPHWATYFAVKSAATAASEATKLGGKVIVPVQPIPGIGRFCGITSPQGVTFWVMEYSA